MSNDAAGGHMRGEEGESQTPSFDECDSCVFAQKSRDLLALQHGSIFLSSFGAKLDGILLWNLTFTRDSPSYNTVYLG